MPAGSSTSSSSGAQKCSLCHPYHTPLGIADAGNLLIGREDTEPLGLISLPLRDIRELTIRLRRASFSCTRKLLMVDGG